MHTDVRFPWLAPAVIVMSREEIAHYRQYEAPKHAVTLHQSAIAGRVYHFATCTCGDQSGTYYRPGPAQAWQRTHEENHA